MANEKRLIDANALMERLKFKRRISEVGLYRGLESAMAQCAKAPTIDTVEVVRCKDCAVPHNKWTGCPNLNGLIPPPDFYCARGERRTDG